jgi:hypothetical protein
MLLSLKRARLAGRRVPTYYITNDYFDPPVIVDSVNPLMLRPWKILTYTETGRVVSGCVQGLDIANVSPKWLETAIRAASAIGNGLYGVDLKQVRDDYVVIEVHDNPTIAEGEEDQRARRLYKRLIRPLAGEWS